MLKSSAPACSAPTPALGAHPLKQSPQQPSSWCLLGACCIWAILYDLTHGISLAQVAPLSLVRLLQKGGERTYNSGVSQAFKGAVFFYKFATFRDDFH